MLGIFEAEIFVFAKNIEAQIFWDILIKNGVNLCTFYEFLFISSLFFLSRTRPPKHAHAALLPTYTKKLRKTGSKLTDQRIFLQPNTIVLLATGICVFLKHRSKEIK